MSDFFRGWRRKLGCVTLVLACVFMAGWIRSQGITDIVGLPTRRATTDSTVNAVLVSVISAKNIIVLQRDFGVFSGPSYQWGLTAGPDSFRWRQTRDQPDLADHRLKWHWHILGFGSFEELLSLSEENHIRQRSLLASYSSIVIPLTLISAFLLLSKPRIVKPTPIVEPAIAERAVNHG